MAGQGTQFLVWAPRPRTVELHLVAPHERLLPVQQLERGYWGLIAPGVAPGAEYFYRLGGQHDRPDPASYFQPHGVHKASQVIVQEFAWTDRPWHGLPLADYVI